jgi:hypothetical protein
MFVLLRAITTTNQNYFAALDEEVKALVNLEQMTEFWVTA